MGVRTWVGERPVHGRLTGSDPLLSAYGPAAGAAALGAVTGRLPRVGAIATVGAALHGPALASYSAVLAGPARHGAPPRLPALFTVSGTVAASGMALLVASPRESGPARLAAVLGAIGESAAAERRLGVVAETWREGRAGTLLRTACALTLAGAATAALVGRRGGPAGNARGLGPHPLRGLRGSRRPRLGRKYTVVPQRKGRCSIVTVSLTGASKEDVATVFGVLRTAFPTDRPSGDVPHEQPGDRLPVWTAVFDPTEERIPTGPTPLEGSVTDTLQGGYVAVDRLREALSGAFAVQERGTASGDQEKEVDLQLRTKR